MSLTRRDLARALKERLGGTIQDNDFWLSELFDVVRESVAKGKRIELRGFGTFESREIASHKTKNPVTGKAMTVPKSYTVDFRPAQGFKEKLKPKKSKRKKKPNG